MTGRPLAWPTRERLSAGVTGALIVSLVFFPIYLGGSLIAGMREQRLHPYAGFELAIPFWPFMIIPYLSRFVLFVMPPLQLNARELGQLVRRLVVASLGGGLVFLCLPSEIGFVDRSDAGIWQPLYDAIYSIDGHFNAVPSFHVIYTASILLAMIDVATPRLQIGYGLWLVLVCASTVLTHRHQLLDVALGLAVAFAVRAVAHAKAPARVQLPEVSR